MGRMWMDATFGLAFDPDGAGRLERYQRVAAPDVPLGTLLTNLDRESPGQESVHSKALRSLLREIAEVERGLLEKVVSRRCAAARRSHRRWRFDDGCSSRSRHT
jgi:hypothetical protein